MLNSADLVAASYKGASEEQVHLAKKLARHYMLQCKLKWPSARPFSLDVPLECQVVFKHFVGAVKIAEECEVSILDFLHAQFEEMAWTKKLPWPEQLANGGARIRLMQYMAEKGSRATQEAGEDDCQFDSSERAEQEERKLKNYMKVHQLREKAALKQFSREFSDEFLMRKGFKPIEH